tara:strand:- start:501 stop:761 length:261 start_codon:yes stop_codon:yes gene_type:complete
MIEFEDIKLIRFVEGFLDEKETKQIEALRQKEEFLNKRIEKFEKVIKSLKKFNEILNKKKRPDKEVKPLPANLLRISDYLQKRKIS